MIDLLPCQFCGSTSIDAEGWASTDRAGPACDDCAGTADTVELWNSRPKESHLAIELEDAQIEIRNLQNSGRVSSHDGK